MRLFIAIEIPKEIKLYLVKIQEYIGNDMAKVKWVNKEQMHLTLKFLGEVQPNILEDIKEELKKIKFRPFTVYLNSIGVFPGENYIRVVWVGLKPEDKIIGLQREVDGNLKKVFKKEKDYNPHLTLGRVKFVYYKNKFLSKLKETTVENKKFDVNNFKLIKSTLTEKGPVYEEVEIFDSLG